MHIFTSNENIYQNTQTILKDTLNILLQRSFRDFMNMKDREDIHFIIFNVKCLNVYTHARISTIVKKALTESVFASQALQLKHKLCSTNFQVLLRSYS